MKKIKGKKKSKSKKKSENKKIKEKEIKKKDALPEWSGIWLCLDTEQSRPLFNNNNAEDKKNYKNLNFYIWVIEDRKNTTSSKIFEYQKVPLYIQHQIDLWVRNPNSLQLFIGADKLENWYELVHCDPCIENIQVFNKSPTNGVQITNLCNHWNIIPTENKLQPLQPITWPTIQDIRDIREDTMMKMLIPTGNEMNWKETKDKLDLWSQQHVGGFQIWPKIHDLLAPHQK